jgi:hypothetical protein
MGDLAKLAELLRRRGAIEAEIANLIDRPAERGHVGEYIAKHVFDIRMHISASHKGSDGIFASGPLAGRSVNVKFYATQQFLLDVTLDAAPDYYLVLAGPTNRAASSRGASYPWEVSSVHLFQSVTLLEGLYARGVKLGVATSIAQHFWQIAEVYPTARSSLIVLSDGQRKQLA